MKLYYVYIVRCIDDALYIGFTNDIERRIVEHNLGRTKSSYTHKRRPVTLVFLQDFNDVEQAISFEKQIKKWTRVKKEALIKNDFDRIQILSECRNYTHSDFKPS